MLEIVSLKFTILVLLLAIKAVQFYLKVFYNHKLKQMFMLI